MDTGRPRTSPSRGNVARERVYVRVNWGALVDDLMSAGLSMREVAERVDVTHAALSRARFGDMRHATGERLVVLWMQTTGLDREALPLSDGLECEP